MIVTEIEKLAYEKETPGIITPRVRGFILNNRSDYFAMSLRAFKGRTLMTFRAGLALNICSVLVNGLMPMWALVAGFWITMIFIRPGATKIPGPLLPTFLAMRSVRALRMEATCLRESWVVVTMLEKISLLVGAPFYTKSHKSDGGLVGSEVRR